jgi:hypothetical protein
MTARIGYLTTLTSGHGGVATLRPPRMLFPLAGPADPELTSWRTPPRGRIGPGPADAGAPAQRAAGQIEAEPSGRPGDTEPWPVEPPAAPGGARLPTAAPPVEPAGGDGAPAPSQLIPASATTSGPDGMLRPRTEVDALASAAGLAADTREPPARPARSTAQQVATRAAADAAEQAGAGTAGLAPGSAAAHDPLIPASLRPGAAPPASPAMPASGNPLGYPRAAGRGLNRPAGTRPVRHSAGAAASSRPGSGPAEPEQHGGSVLHASRQLPSDQTAFPPQPGGRPVATAARAGNRAERPARAEGRRPGDGEHGPQLRPPAGRPPDEPATSAGRAVMPRRPPQARARPAPASGRTHPPTLSIGTIEVVVVPPPQPPASASPRQRRSAPDRLSRGLGPRFGHGQT